MTDIWVPLAAAGLGGVLAIAASLTVYILEKHRSEREAQHAAKRLAVSRMIDVLEYAVRMQAQPPLVRRWKAPDATVLMALSHLLLDLPKEDLPMARWAGGQVQRMAYERGGKAYLARATQLQFRLVSWFRGETGRKWFEEALEQEPFFDEGRPPMTALVKAEARDMVQIGGYIAAFAFAYVVVKDRLLPALTDIVHALFQEADA